MKWRWCICCPFFFIILEKKTVGCWGVSFYRLTNSPSVQISAPDCNTAFYTGFLSHVIDLFFFSPLLSLCSTWVRCNRGDGRRGEFGVPRHRGQTPFHAGKRLCSRTTPHRIQQGRNQSQSSSLWGCVRVGQMGMVIRFDSVIKYMHSVNVWIAIQRSKAGLWLRCFSVTAAPTGVSAACNSNHRFALMRLF